jgi:hypothetical protein
MDTFAAPSVCVDNLKLQMQLNLEDKINIRRKACPWHVYSCP